MTIADFAQPNTGVVDFLFAGGLLALVTAAIYVIYNFFVHKPKDKE